MDLTPLMRQLADQIVTEARSRISGGAMGRAGSAITVESIGPTSLTIVAGPPASFLIRGWPAGPMTWLVGKVVSFTPKGGGTQIVRKVTARSLAAGHWRRPARPANDVLTQAWQAPPTQAIAGQVADAFLAPLQASRFTTWASPAQASSAVIPDIF